MLDPTTDGQYNLQNICKLTMLKQPIKNCFAMFYIIILTKLL